MSYKKKSIITGALILTAANIITRLLGFVYRIYMSNAIGAEGMGLYQLIMPVYNLAWSISCSGFTTTVSKLVAQENAKKEYGNMGRVLKQALFITCGIGTVLTFVMFFGADYIGGTILGESRVIISLKILSVAVPFMAAGSCIRGYFFGLQESMVPASSQVLEQCIRMGVIYLLAATFIPRGLEYACAAAVIGIFFGELISFIYVLASYRIFKRKNSLTSRPTISPVQTLGIIFSMALPLTLNRISGSFLSTVENILIPQKLQQFGLTSEQAMISYGKITGMAMPLIFFPSAILVALSISLVPSISESMAVKNTKRVTYTTSKSMLFTSIIAFGASIIFLVFPTEIGMLIYKQDIGEMLFLLGIMCPFWYLSITLGGILNGLGQQVFIFRNSLLSSFINILFIYFFVPTHGVNAFIFGWFISLLIVTFLDIDRIKECTKIKVQILRWFAKPALAALATGLTVEYTSKHFIFPVLGSTWGLISSLGFICAMYAVLIILLGCISIGDIKGLFKRVMPKA